MPTLTEPTVLLGVVEIEKDGERKLLITDKHCSPGFTSRDLPGWVPGRIADGWYTQVEIKLKEFKHLIKFKERRE